MIESWGRGYSSCSFEAFVSRAVTRARRGRLGEHERGVGGCGEGCWQGCYERSINAAASIHPWTHVSPTCRRRTLSRSLPIPFSLCPLSPSSFPSSLSRGLLHDAPRSSFHRSREVLLSLVDTTREKGSWSLPMYSRESEGLYNNRLAREPPATAGSEMTDTTAENICAALYIRARLGNDVAARKRAARCSIDFLAKRRREGAHFCADT